MNVIVVGCGRVGSQLANFLSVEGHNVTVIDKDAEAFRRLGTTFNGVTIRGLGFDEDVLIEAGIKECDSFAAVTDLDNTNLMAAEVARKLFGVRHVLARLYNPIRERTYQQLGLDYVCGTTLVAENLMDKIMSGHGHHISALGDVEIIEFKLNREAEARMVQDVESATGCRIVAVSRGKTTFIPSGDSALRAGDVVMGAVKEEAFTKVERYMEE